MKFGQFIKNYFPECTLSTQQNIVLSTKLGFEAKNELNNILSWPPNVFMIVYSLLEYTDKYRLMVSPQSHFTWDYQKDNKTVQFITAEWLALISIQSGQQGNSTISSFINLEYSLGKVFSSQNFDIDIYDLMNTSEFATCAMYLLLSVDELFSDVDICDYKLENRLQLLLLMRNSYFPSQRKNLADNDCKLGFVTYKTSVPQTGLTLNNLTHSLTCIKPSVLPEVVANKHLKQGYNKKSYNILFLPWPFTIESDAFKPTTNQIKMDGYFGSFDYLPDDKYEPSKFLQAILATLRRCGTIDLIVFPECALSDKTFNKYMITLHRLFDGNAPSILSGIFGNVGSISTNKAKLSFIGELGIDTIEQSKHHRWFLDETQVRNYNLASSLDLGRKWWENIAIDRRHLVTLHTANGVKLCPLICEDLARQEPVAQAVRSVGPNLVVSLLLDGPQLDFRWPGKYSAVLSDDPGSSVLSVTAPGMTQRATGLGHPPSRQVALWSEPGGSAETLKIDEDGLGIVIELEVKDEPMWTIDGRKKVKPVLRKKKHTTVLPRDANIINTSVLSLQTELRKIIKKSGGIK
ncbi:hypothetical protein VHA01S_073_00040 [Vibrio halioticoli NBRC 102217]|uniref:Uncharacterized protein n=1 Tax=Vibrio halioticoli NBRC 102217 TaxID=1219072 RepID=V5FRA3_9VIBR|nr:hypothetical protein [Vibrio halioticoli]GAD91192.1 hypothetical protein VHA01S_073_00040 [Vibrio halioticoli NBRC 102217]